MWASSMAVHQQAAHHHPSGMPAQQYHAPAPFPGHPHGAPQATPFVAPQPFSAPPAQFQAPAPAKEEVPEGYEIAYEYEDGTPAPPPGPGEHVEDATGTTDRGIKFHTGHVNATGPGFNHGHFHGAHVHTQAPGFHKTHHGGVKGFLKRKVIRKIQKM